MAPVALELIFLHLTPRLYFQRIIIIASLMVVSINVQWVDPTPWVAVFAFIAAHNIMTAFNVPFFYGAIDLVLMIAEVIAAGKYAAQQFFTTWIPETYLFHVVLGWVIVGSLSAAISMRIGIVIRTRGRSLITPFTLLGDHPPTSRETKPFNLLLGRSIWRQNFVGEVLSIRTIRGILAIIILSAIFFFMLLKVIFAPVKETALSPVKEYRIPGYTPWDLYEEIYVPTWNVIYPLALQEPINRNTNLSTLITADDFFFAVNITAIWPDHIDKSLTPDCIQENDLYNDLPVYSYRCEPAWLNNGTYFLLPGLQVNVDFGLLSPGLSKLKNASPRMNLPLVFSLVNSTFYDALTYTMPTLMMPGTNMAASVVMDVRQVYTRPMLAALGMFEIMETFWMPRYINFYPDPFSAFTGLNRSTLNLFWQDNYGELRFVQDYRQNSVVDGFAAVGGLWTAFSGIFALIFGATMLHTLYGTKPLSIFGVAHSFQSQEMKRECLRLYPNILKEDSVPEQRGLLSLLRDHLIDLSFLEPEKPKPSALPPPPQDEEKANIVDSPEAPQPVLGYHPDGDRTSGSQTASDTANNDTANVDTAPWPRGPRGPRKTL